MKYTIGTRGSPLSLAQTKWVISELKKKSPETVDMQYTRIYSKKLNYAFEYFKMVTTYK